MAILNFVKPDKIVLQKANDFEAQFEFRPLEPGYGVTIGNALRRVLLNSLEGHAIVGIKIEGADHEFATIKGVSEDLVEIILNLKQVRFKKKVSPGDTLIFKLELVSPVRRGIATMRGIAYVGDSIVTEGLLTAQIAKKE